MSRGDGIVVLACGSDGASTHTHALKPLSPSTVGSTQGVAVDGQYIGRTSTRNEHRS